MARCVRGGEGRASDGERLECIMCYVTYSVERRERPNASVHGVSRVQGDCDLSTDTLC